MTDAHSAGVLGVYVEGMRTGNATFETEAPSWEAFDAGHLPEHRWVALDQADPSQVLGWVAVSPVSDRCVYAGVLEHSVYVSEAARGRGVGRALMLELIRSTEAAGVWTLQSGIHVENDASRALHAAVGFREVGLRLRLGQREGIWRDIVMVERRSTVVGV